MLRDRRCQNSGSCEDAARSCPGRRRPRVETRFVSWKLMTTASTIGNHEKTPKMRSSGSRNTRVLEAAAAAPR